MGGIVFGAVVPHGPVAVAEACTDEELELAGATRAGCEELGRRCAAAQAETVVVVTPHNVHVEGAMAVVRSSALEGAVSGTAGRTIGLECRTDGQLAALALEELRSAGVPSVGVSFGGNRIDEAVMPMDWGVLIPLWHFGARATPPVRTVVVSPARDLPPEAHVAAGRALARAAERSSARVALVASADHGHAQTADGPYGYHRASAEYDEVVARAIGDNRLAGLLELEREFVEQAAADSWWQLLVLHGALGDDWEADLLSYEVPSYYGMLCASFTPT